MHSPKRKPWLKEVRLPQEDEAIRQLVDELGEHQWALLASKLRSQYKVKGRCEISRTGKHCRERWLNYLQPSICSSEWTEEDEQELFCLHRVHGNSWSEIAKHLKNRTHNEVKNHFYSTVRRNLRSYNKTHSPPLTGHLKNLITDPCVAEILLQPSFQASRRPRPVKVAVRQSVRSKSRVDYRIDSSDDDLALELQSEPAAKPRLPTLPPLSVVTTFLNTSPQERVYQNWPAPFWFPLLNEACVLPPLNRRE